ncbi:MAG: hypothetical protein PHS14_04740 [Elusimicrobia bacterium]|nr:hypothetical protein [Elusimicrobiota bacterium]
MRLMLVEFFRGALRRNERSMLFPFLKGLAGKRGFETLWLCYGGDIAHQDAAAEGRALFAAMPEEDLRSLSRRLKSFRPTHVVTSDALSPEARALLSSRAPGAKHLVMPLPGDLPDASPGEDWRGEAARCGWFLDWLGVKAPALAGRYLVEAAVPDYAAVLANKAARGAKPQITIAGGVLCANRRTVAKNPHFAGVDLGGLEHRGCSFCPIASRLPITAPGTKILPLIETQFRRILKTAGRGGRSKDRYEFFDVRAFFKFDALFAMIIRLKVPPAVFMFNPRLDDVLRLKGRIKKMLPALAAAGHEIRILSMGVENFSERENARFNKDITLAQVDEFLALMESWGGAYPGVFMPYRAGNPVVEIGLILFTPWTTLEDIRLNLTRAAERGFPGRGYWLYSILLLEPATPIFRLAKKEADVLVDRFPDRGQVYGLFKNEGELEEVHPWRFKDAKAADFFAMHVRVCAADREGEDCAFFRGDEAYAGALRLYREANQGAEVTPLAIAFELLELLEAARPSYEREELLREAVRRAAARPAPVAGKAAAGQSPRKPLRPERAAIDETARLLRNGKSKDLGAITIESAEPASPEEGAIRLNLLVDGRALSLALFAADHAGPAFIQSGPFKAIYLKDGREWQGKDLSAVAERLRLLVARIGEAAEKARKPAKKKG